MEAFQANRTSEMRITVSVAYRLQTGSAVPDQTLKANLNFLQGSLLFQLKGALKISLDLAIGTFFNFRDQDRDLDMSTAHAPVAPHSNPVQLVACAPLAVLLTQVNTSNGCFANSFLVRR